MKSLCGMLALLAFTACSNNDDDTGSGNGNHFWSVTLQASMGSTATRALSEESGNTIIASFAQNDEVVVVDADGSTIVGTLKAKTTGENTILEGTHGSTFPISFGSNSNSFILQWNVKLDAKVSISRDSAKFLVG